MTSHLQQFVQELEHLRQETDQVMVDATPLLPDTDGAIASKTADVALLVVRFGKTTRERVATSTDALAQVDARLLGTAMSSVPTRLRGFGFEYGYFYGGGYGGYGDSARAD